MTPLELAVELAGTIRAAVRPRLGRDRDVVGRAASGDTTFRLDLVAEEATSRYVAASGLTVVVYSEDRGRVGPADAEYLLVVDPIDGTRPAKAGFESCCASVAVALNRPDARVADIIAGAVYELRDDRLFAAERGGGVTIREGGRPIEPRPSTRTEIGGLALCVEVTGRPLLPNAVVLADLVDGNSLEGGCFSFASISYALTRLVTGQLDAVVDVADRIRRDRPDLEPLCRRAGGGRQIALFAYDLAASLLLAAEAGLTVSDAYGNTLDRLRLTDVSLANQCSLVAAGNAPLHAAVLASLEPGWARLNDIFPEGRDE